MFGTLCVWNTCHSLHWHRYLRFKPCKSLSLALVSESDVKNLWFILPDVANRAVT